MAAPQGIRKRRKGLDVALRVAIAMLGGYAAMAACTMLLARVWPADRLDATLWSTMLSFGLYAGLVVWAFAARSALRAGLVVAGIGLAAALGAVPAA